MCTKLAFCHVDVGELGFSLAQTGELCLWGNHSRQSADEKLVESHIRELTGKKFKISAYGINAYNAFLIAVQGMIKP